MPYEDSYKAPRAAFSPTPAPLKTHSLALEDRKSLTLTGVEEVERFDERQIVLQTALGALVILGEELSVSRLSVDSGDVIITGRIDALEYEDGAPAGEGFFARLFK